MVLLKTADVNNTVEVEAEKSQEVHVVHPLNVCFFKEINPISVQIF